MDKQRILKEAQSIASKFSFWMVSGNITHLYGYPYETADKKYELEIKFEDDFPKSPPRFIYSQSIKDLLGEVYLNNLSSWESNSSVIDAVHELKAKIQEELAGPVIIEEETLVPISSPLPTETTEDTDDDQFITPDLNAYPSEISGYGTPKIDDYTPEDNSNYGSSTSQESLPASVAANTELSLIQQYYAYDQRGASIADINIYLTVTITKTFIIGINFSNYPNKPEIDFPNEIVNIIGNPFNILESLVNWNPSHPPHITDIFQELESKLYFIQDIELQAKKILGEYQCDLIEGSATKLRVHLLTYGFMEYLLDIDLAPYPKPPLIEVKSDLKQIINAPIEMLNSYKNWEENKSEPVEILREISWLVDKNSRINFEIELLKEHYKNILYDSSTTSIKMEMQGKMKTQDLTFDFQIILPREYPMKVPEIKVLNEFDIDIHEKTKDDLQESFKSFFSEWTPFKYLVDLFNGISEKIFEVSMVSCVICHKIECPTCKVKIAGQNACHVECPYCERAYHKHCWEQTIKSFGKCGFCLKTPPPNMVM